jgi:hypothetical protein
MPLRGALIIADTDAQGFSKEITFPRERWVGYIKDYDSANLMMVRLDLL